MSMKDLLESGKYDREFSEPTPLSEKVQLITEVKTQFYEDLIFRDYKKVTVDIAWKFAEERWGEDEALNPIFLNTVLEYIDRLENFVIDYFGD
jgi:hypothetical protein